MIQERLTYDPETGVFLWRHSRSRSEAWNRRYARKQAGSIVCVGGNIKRRVIRISHDGKKIGIYAANVAWIYVTGEWPADEVDHKDTDACNDAWANLRAATSSQNKMNMKARSGTVTGIKGVWFDKRRGTYCGEVCANGQRSRASGFATEEDAAEFCAAARADMHGEFARAA